MAKKSSNNSKQLQIPKIIILISQFLSVISTKAVVSFAAKLFTTPIKHKVPKRELAMDSNSKQELIRIPAINKQIMVYQYGTAAKKVLLVHGWSGRGTQLFKIADALLNEGYSTISFDGPAHGKSPGNSSILLEFVASILEVEKQFGPFEFAIGHSLGGMAVLNAAKSGLKINSAIVIGSGDVVQDILDDFVSKLKLKPIISEKLRDHFERKYKETIESFSAHKAAAILDIPLLVIHDKHDYEVPVHAGITIHDHAKNSKLILTEGLGHRKILGDSNVIHAIIEFTQNNSSQSVIAKPIA